MQLRAIALLLFAPFFCVGAQERLSVVLDDHYPPYSFRDEHNTLQGITVDQWKAWEYKTGIEVELTGLSWQSAVILMNIGAADVIDPICSTSDRLNFYSFTKPFEEIEVSIFVHESISGVTNVSGLKGFAIAVKRGDACVEFLEDSGISNLMFFDDYEEIIKCSKALDIRVFCMDKPSAIYLMNRYGTDRDFRPAFTLFTGELCRAVNKDNLELLKRVEKGFSAISQDRYRSIERKWLGATLHFASRQEFNPILSVFGLCLVTCLFVAIVLLRRKIRLNHAELERHVHRFEAGQKRIRLIINAIPDLFFIINKEGTYVDYSSSDESRIKQLQGGLIGKNVSDVFSDSEAVLLMKAIKDVLKCGGVRQVEYTLDVPAGNVQFECRIVPLDENNALCFSRDISERLAHEKEVMRSLHEKEVLLKEIHHRVKNNLQVISSLVSLQADMFVDEQDRVLMRETQQRIQSMAQLHELLYQSDDFLFIDISEYLNGIVDELAMTWHSISSQIAIVRNIQSIPMSLEIALPLGLIVNELVSNTLKHAFLGSVLGTLEIDFVSYGDDFVLSVRDDGCGLPAGFNIENAKSLGFVLVRSFVQQLDGTISVRDSGGGALIDIRFKGSVLKKGRPAPL
jgi:two-component sensor histidine kinase/ABC-type amino acid transport substrate-binding protein